MLARSLPPLSSANTAAEEARHRLIGTPDLHLHEKGLIAGAPLINALHLSLVDIIPCIGTTNDVCSLLAGELFAFKIGFLQVELVWTGAAFEAMRASAAVNCVSGLSWVACDGEHVAAGWADWMVLALQLGTKRVKTNRVT